MSELLEEEHEEKTELGATEDLSAWVEVSRAALRHNLQQVKAFVGPRVKVLAVVKANAYGHGAARTARVLEEAGADYFGVTRLEEGLALRDAGIKGSVLVFSPALPSQAAAFVEHGLTATVHSIEAARTVSTAAQAKRILARLHVEVDTGMGRGGVSQMEVPSFLKEVSALGHVTVEGLFTHLATAQERNKERARRQVLSLRTAVTMTESLGLRPPIVHCANSSALLDLPASHFDMVRTGTLLYGQHPSRHVTRKLNLRQTFLLKARVMSVAKVPSGTSVGYGCEWTARAPATLATIAVGYGDGYRLVPEARTETVREILRRLLRLVAIKVKLKASPRTVVVRGRRVPVLGRIAMQQMTLDVSRVPGVAVGDVVTLPVRRTSVPSEVPRVYVD